MSNFNAETEKQQRAARYCQKLAEAIAGDNKSGASLVLTGNVGTGKTHLACAVARHVIENCKTAWFMSVASAVRHVRETYAKDSQRTEADALADLIGLDLLILDEIGIQANTEHESRTLFEIINTRYQECKSTILISNFNQQQLNAYLGDRIMDRFRESGAIVAFDWASYRGRKHGEITK